MLRPTTRAGVAALVLVVPALAGCGPAPVGTSAEYAPSDGISASVGPVQVRNLLIVGSDAGQPAVVSGVLLNAGADPARVTLATDGAGRPEEVVVPGQGSVQLGALGPGENPAGAPRRAVVQFSSLAKPAGAMAAVTVSTGGEATTVQVPILAAVGEYATITPTGKPTAAG